MSNRLFMLAAALVITGCGGSEPDNTATETTTAPAATTQTAKPEMTPMERGAILYKRCRACHTLDDGGRHKVGPNLWNIYGRTAGTMEGFNYSKSMTASEIVWTDETLSDYIENPSKYIAGNRMSFVGLRKAEDRAALLEYLRAETGG
ncbi:c-type cytochrome [Algimonas porphyrae]|uniref:Cytochrome c domain-containing protein n=2 Tax=Algimonas porphyrae TaxID=1128113 RepID=A0ABQ5UXR5_9PROT|nr:cytochrome c family protein [Algimonas porphyrae]GLQ20103.1 hypothetical protein GCM10007854_10580 [Algimonas porphyrae]